MSVAAHLGIRLSEYDARIRTFIPDYEELLDAVAASLGSLRETASQVTDLGTGTGALADLILRQLPGAVVTAFDEDPAILALAGERLRPFGTRASVVAGNFLDVEIPRSHAVVASLALHHVRTAERKQAFYARLRGSLPENGLLVSADCIPSADERLAEAGRRAWRMHLRRTYSDAETDGYFAAWAAEDVYFPLPEELAMLAQAGFSPDVVWRRGTFAVIAARSSSARVARF